MKGKSAIKIIVALGLVTLLFSCGTGTPKNTLEKIKKEGKLVIATHPVNPPFEFGAGTGVDGFDYDLAENIAKDMGVETQWIKKQFDKCFEYLKTGEVDMVINAVTITPERETEYLFSDPYFETGQIIAVRKERDDIKTADDLKGKKVGVQKNTTAEAYLKNMGDVDIVEFDSFDDALFELNRKLLDAVVGDAPTIQYDIRLLANLKTVGQLLTHEKYGIVFRKNETELRDAVNKILEKMKQNGKLQELIEKWKLETPAEPAVQEEQPAKTS